MRGSHSSRPPNSQPPPFAQRPVGPMPINPGYQDQRLAPGSGYQQQVDPASTYGSQPAGVAVAPIDRGPWIQNQHTVGGAMGNQFQNGNPQLPALPTVSLSGHHTQAAPRYGFQPPPGPVPMNPVGPHMRFQDQQPRGLATFPSAHLGSGNQHGMQQGYGDQPPVAAVYQQSSGVVQPTNPVGPHMRFQDQQPRGLATFPSAQLGPGNQHGMQQGYGNQPPVPPVYQQTSGMVQPNNLSNRQEGFWNEHEGSWQPQPGPVWNYRSQQLPALLPPGTNQQRAVHVPKSLVCQQAEHTVQASAEQTDQAGDQAVKAVTAPPPKVTVNRIKMDGSLTESNLDFMFSFNGKRVQLRDQYAYYSFPSPEAAQSAYDKFNNPNDGYLFDIKVGVDLTCDTPTRGSVAHGDTSKPIQSDVSGSCSGPEGRKRSTDIAAVDQLVKGDEKKQRMTRQPSVVGMHAGAFKWRPVKDFKAMKGNTFVLPYKFDLATGFGSVNPDVSMSSSTPIGNRVFVGILGYLNHAISLGLCWGGCLSPENFLVCNNMTCAIVPFPTKPATHENIKADVGSVVYSMMELFTLDGKYPPYFEHLSTLIGNIPPDISSNSQALEQFFRELINHFSFLLEDKVLAFLQEFQILFKNLDWKEKDELNTQGANVIAAREWQKPTKTDRLLQKVFDSSLMDLFKTVGDEAQYLRHLGVHSGDHIFQDMKDLRAAMLEAIPCLQLRQVLKPGIIATLPQPILTAKERAMLIAYYFKDFLAVLLCLLFRSMKKHEWINQLCTPFIKKTFEIGAAPLGSVILEGESALWHSLNGAGPRELILYLKAVIRALWNVRTFRYEVTRKMELHKLSHLDGDDISCALCAFSESFTKLSDGSEHQPSATYLLNVLVQAYSENKDVLKGGRNYTAEILEMILKCLHRSCTGEPQGESGQWDCHSDFCLAHVVYGLDSVESFCCEKCGSDCADKRSGKFIYYIAAATLRIQKKKYPEDCMGALLNRNILETSKFCDKCQGKMVCHGHSIVSSPSVFSLVLEWGPEDTATEILETISSEIDISAVYSGLHKKTDHHLVSMICHEENDEGHFVCFALNKNRWIMYDKDVSEVFTCWGDVTILCKERTLRPHVLLFADAD